MVTSRRQERDWGCRSCPAGNGTLCDALMRGAGRLAKNQTSPVRQSTFSAAAGEIVYRTAEASTEVFAVCQGWATRFVALADGRRQTLAVLLPGDLSLGALFQGRLRFSVAVVTPLRITRFDRAGLKRPRTVRLRRLPT
jgi:hypothetical protein